MNLQAMGMIWIAGVMVAIGYQRAIVKHYWGV